MLKGQKETKYIVCINSNMFPTLKQAALKINVNPKTFASYVRYHIGESKDFVFKMWEHTIRIKIIE